MDRALDMSLDDIIKSRKSNGRGRVGGVGLPGRGVRGSFGRGRMAGLGARVRGSFFGRGRIAGLETLREQRLGVNARPSAFTIAKSFRRRKNISWQNDLFEESLTAAGLSRSESSTKLFISNLDNGVSNDDIRELFSEVGELKRYAIHFDKNGRPSGSAEVVYARRSDAFAALKRYNNVQLDGRPMKIEIQSPSSDASVSARVNVIGGTNGRTTRKVILGQDVGGTRSLGPVNRGAGPRTQGGLQNGQGRQRPRAQQGTGGRMRSNSQGQGRGLGRVRGRGQGNKKHGEKSAAELDKELEKYHADAMQT
ncbi:hypothetical protein Dimus_022021 [Dionaea muscipula]